MFASDIRVASPTSAATGSVDARVWDVPRSAYVHVPFCARRCGYCNFSVVAGRRDLVPDYLRALGRELTWLGAPQPVRTLYVGGGTPTELDARTLAQLLALLARWFPLESPYEFTVEANPLDIEPQKLAVLVAHGVNRLSLGIQSFHTPKLKVLERDHDGGQARAAVRRARGVFPRLAVDLIFGAPGETLQDWECDLAQALALGPDHVSTYGLTVEKGTRFWNRWRRGELQRCSDDLELGMYEAAIDTLAARGWQHYEVSNFALPQCRSRHNETYWLGEPYFGVGPGAARYVAGVRETNHRSPFAYLRRMLAGDSPVAEREFLGAEASARERLVFGLRRLEGIDEDWFERVTGWNLERLAGPVLRAYLDHGWLERSGSQWRLTRRGLVVSDGLWPDLLG